MLLELIERAKNNDNDAMLELINRFDRVIRKYARLLKYEDAYEDVVMEFIAFIRKFQIENIKKKHDGAIVNYVCTTLRNTYIELSKRHSAINSHEMPISDLSDEQKYMVENSIVEAPNERIDLIAYLSDNILTAYQQRIILLHFYHRLSIEEIAHREGVSRQNVNKAKKAALDKLRKSDVL
ncbi:sigma-70 family RNA polymerase sigma factor [Clostridium sp. J1101437_171009_A5]|uniref:RNA polymerase sigma factor n=1 Tax=Clostridium sp. J1101437_171009_A5 TaxID=2787098 RepID=UPI00189A83A4|nr:sigma-70 family RNA polymerase sigma factor [Clostridium sp. J1101437_171009_A5]